jgi:hypothetical protein
MYVKYVTQIGFVMYVGAVGKYVMDVVPNISDGTNVLTAVVYFAIIDITLIRQNVYRVCKK